MTFAPAPTDEIKARLDIVQLISEYLPVKKAGTRFVASCPFHHEKTPSFSISPDNQFWYCFGCGEGGDIFDFVERMEGLDFPETLKLLARKAGVQLRDEDMKATGERQRLHEMNELAARLWNEVLMRQKAGEKAREYTGRRQLQDATVEDWKIGFAPDSWDFTLNFLRQHGFRDDEILKGGLALKSERTGNLFDRFRNRVMFPIRDANGNVAGFTGRVMPGPGGKDPEGEPKYMNTPQTLAYDKSRIIFGLDRARQEIRRQNLAVIVEGNMDVIASHQAGVTNVVASSGTALTEEHLRLLKRFADRLVLAFDVDVAGENAARRGVGLAMAAGFVVRVLTLPPGAGKDADDAIRKDVEIWKRAIAEAVPYLEWFIGKVRSRTDMNDPEAKRRASDDLLAEVAKVPQPVERTHWAGEVAELFHTPLSLILDAVEKLANRHARESGKAVTAAPAGPERRPVVKRPRNRHEVVSEYVLALLVRWPALLASAVDNLPPTALTEEHQPLYTALVLAYNKQRSGAGDLGPDLTFADLSPGEAVMSTERRNVLQLLAEKEFDMLLDEARRETLVRLVGELKDFDRLRERRILIDEMAGAERRGDDEAIRRIQEQQKETLV
jgi:DNA primase